MLRDHKAFPIDKFNLLYNRGDKDNTPLDHFQDCENIRAIGLNSFGSRFGIGISQDVSVPLTNVRRIYNFPTQTANTLIVLCYDPNTDTGTIYHVVSSTLVYGPILTITGMTDFAFLPYDGRGYISPFASQFPTYANPTKSPKLLASPGAGIEAGVHGYEVTFVTAGGETLGSPLVNVTTFTEVDPSTAVLGLNGNIPGTPPAFQNVLVAGDTYHWALTFSGDDPSVFPPTHETDISPATAGLVAIANAGIGIELVGAAPANSTFFRIYRTLGNGAVYHLEQDWSAIANLTNTSPTSLIAVGLVTDATLAGNATAPVSNNTQCQQVSLTGIPTGPSGTVTQRKIYRTAAGDSQLKFLHTIVDDTTTTYTDTAADGTLGANIPTKNTAVIPNTEASNVGLQNEFLYVYDGLGDAARKAAGSGPTGTMTIANGAAGHTDPGIHIFGIVTLTDTGYFSPPSILTEFTTLANQSVSFGNIPTSGDPHVIARYLVASIVIPASAFTGNLSGYDMFFVPGAVINNNTDTFLNNISFYDADLVDDATYLFDNYTEIPAGSVLTLYNGRLVLAATYTDMSLLLVSSVGQPESINQVDGIMVYPLNGEPITNASELRDVLYVTKRDRTGAFTDNGDVPSSWPFDFIDNALGSFVHGIATVLDSGGTNVDFLIICTYQGVSLFNGRYTTPELSYKIEQFWKDLDNTDFNALQVVNSPVNKEIYIVLPNRKLLVGNYANGLDPKNIRWAPWSFVMGVNTVAINDINEIIFGADLVV